jgi:hypothetical protein
MTPSQPGGADLRSQRRLLAARVPEPLPVATGMHAGWARAGWLRATASPLAGKPHRISHPYLRRQTSSLRIRSYCRLSTVAIADPAPGRQPKTFWNDRKGDQPSRTQVADHLTTARELAAQALGPWRPCELVRESRRPTGRAARGRQNTHLLSSGPRCSLFWARVETERFQDPWTIAAAIAVRAIVRSASIVNKEML